MINQCHVAVPGQPRAGKRRPFFVESISNFEANQGRKIQDPAEEEDVSNLTLSQWYGGVFPNGGATAIRLGRNVARQQRGTHLRAIS
ncbi:hypothetical protein KM043_006970 [Ampulex compressa]|nr:hypothetical protein KM043_006970 [Ampulex compressa]